jgi:hypothetical protein
MTSKDDQAKDIETLIAECYREINGPEDWERVIERAYRLGYYRGQKKQFLKMKEILSRIKVHIQ